MTKYQKILIFILVAIEIIIGITAVVGGINLIATNGLGMPISYLEHSPFQSFIFPGLLLSIIIGGTNIIASVLVIKKSDFMLEFSAVAGFGIMLWIFGELYIIGHSHWLQVLYFALGTIILISIMLMQKSFIMKGRIL